MISLYEMQSESVPALGFTHPCRIFIELCNIRGSSYTLAEHSRIHVNSVVPLNWVLHYIFTPSTKSHLARIALYHEFPLDGIRTLWFCLTVTEHDWRYTWRLRSLLVIDALWGCNGVGLDIHLETIIHWEWRSTWRFWLWWQLIWKQWIRSEVQLERRLYSLLN